MSEIPKIYLSPTAVAERYRASQSTVRKALASGDLITSVVIKGPSGNIISIGIRNSDAESWSTLKRPRKSLL
jgi:hypothetical protein